MDIKDPNAPATFRQRMFLFRLEGKSNKDESLTQAQASQRIEAALVAKGQSSATLTPTEVLEKTRAPKAPRVKKESAQTMYERILTEACVAAQSAFDAKVPVPMVVTEHANPLNDSSPVKRGWLVQGGVCGFAWVKMRNARTGLAKFMKDQGRQSTFGFARTDEYNGGGIHWTPRLSMEGTSCQSMERKEAACAAAASVLVKYGFDAYMDSRMD